MNNHLYRIILAIVTIAVVIVVGAPRGEKEMSFSDLLVKMSSGQTLTQSEQQTLLLEARRMEEVSSLITSMIQPGTKNLEVDGLVTNNAQIKSAEIGDGDVVFDGSGFYVKNNAEASVRWESADGDTSEMYILSTPLNVLATVNRYWGGRLQWWIHTPDGTSSTITFGEDDVITNRPTVFYDAPANYGFRFNLDGKIELHTEGTDGYSTYIKMRETDYTPPAPVQNTYSQIYVKGDKLVIMYNDAGVVRYKYLDLTGTGVTWVHTTTAP